MNTSKILKIATFCQPHCGGTWTIAENLHNGLKKHGIDVRWLKLENDEILEGFEGHIEWSDTVKCHKSDKKSISAAYYHHLIDTGYDGILVDILADPIKTDLLKYIPGDQILKIIIAHNISFGTYSMVKRYGRYAHAVLSVSERIAVDLKQQTGWSDDFCLAIPNAIDTMKFQDMIPTVSPVGELRLISLGRLDEEAKGVMWIPKILERIEGINWQMNIFGDGPAKTKLVKSCMKFGKRVNFYGAVNNIEVPSIFNSHDIFIMPSRFEGFGLTILEAMASGCVPIASRIRKVTDEIITDGVNGFLFPIGSVNEAALAIQKLQDFELLKTMKMKGLSTVVEKFSFDQWAGKISLNILKLNDHRPTTATIEDIENWVLPKLHIDIIRNSIPQPLKNLLRVIFYGK